MPDDSPPPPSFGPWQYLFPSVWVRPRRDGDWDLLAVPWRARPYRYSTAELADYQTKTNRAIMSLLRAIWPLSAILSLLAVLYLSIATVSGAQEVFAFVPWLEPGLALVIAFSILLVLIGIFIYRRNRPAKRNPPRTEAVPFRERWPLIEWWVLDINRWVARGIPTSRWGSFASCILLAIIALATVWFLISGPRDDWTLAPWKSWLLLWICLYGISLTIWLRRLRRRWGDVRPPRWKAPES
jgi:hypothetical protein